MPMGLGLQSKKDLYQWSRSDNFPPHLELIPKNQQVDLKEIFNLLRLAEAVTVIGKLLPASFYGSPNIGNDVAALEVRNQELLDLHYDIGAERNIGERKDWYTDAIFAQAAFTGPNPVTIKNSQNWVTQFGGLAAARGETALVTLLRSSPGSFYVQDFSYFRTAVGAGPKDELKSSDGSRFGCASVTLFQ